MDEMNNFIFSIFGEKLSPVFWVRMLSFGGDFRIR